jgi:hypothetical protein
MYKDFSLTFQRAEDEDFSTVIVVPTAPEHRRVHPREHPDGQADRGGRLNQRESARAVPLFWTSALPKSREGFRGAPPGKVTAGEQQQMERCD